MDTRHGFQIGSIRGIPIRIHYSFLLILPLLAYLFGRSFIDAAKLAQVPAGRLSGSPWIWGLIVAVVLFLAVLVHELAHSLYALSRGFKVRSITLLMIGGVSEMTSMPRAGAEAMMALVGPLTSIAIGVVCYVLYRLSGGLGQFDLTFALFYLAELNLGLGVFNLLPAFPMDGGRVLRGLLARRLGPVRATNIAADVGKAFALGFGVWGLFSGNVILILVAFFVFIGAQGEQHAVLARAVLGDLRVEELMNRNVRAAVPGESVYDVAEQMIGEKRLFMPVVTDGRVVGAVGLEDVEGVPLELRRTTPVGEIMTVPGTVSPSDKVADALRLFLESRRPILAVVEEERLVGTLSELDVRRGLRIRELAASQHQDSRPGQPSLRERRI